LNDNLRDSEPGSATSTASAPGAYDWRDTEARAQRTWREHAAFDAPVLKDGTKGKYIFVGCPFTSGNAHVGHIRSYSIADSYARFLRARGEPVLFSIGFDSFGLPAELEAIRNKMHPREWVEQCVCTMRDEFDRMGFSFDWKRTFVSSDEDMYRWSQSLFLDLLARGLVYQKERVVDWCDECSTVLARVQVEGGRCWRCENPTRLVRKKQWFIRTSAYFVENHELLQQLTRWDKNSAGAQRSVLGRSDGIELEATTVDGQTLPVFTASLEALASATFIAVSPSHPAIDTWIMDDKTKTKMDELRASDVTRLDRKPEHLEAVYTDMQMIVPGASHTLPVVISRYVETRFGPTAAILGIPDEDAIARTIAAELDRRNTLCMSVNKRVEPGKATIRFAAADLLISRQRGWGTPIPLVNCDACGPVPAPAGELPIKLPHDTNFTGAGNPLVEHADFAGCDCPSCGRPARRETDTLDCHVDGIWMWLPICVPQMDRAGAMFTHEESESWLPVHQVVWGIDGGAYMLDHRTCAKMLRDAGMLTCLPDGEPFDRVLMHGMVEHEGRKMSKHLGNAVTPRELIDRVGADTVRLAALYAAAPRNGMLWSERDLAFCHRFLHRLWNYAAAHREILELGQSGSQIERSDKLRARLTKWCDVAVAKITTDLSDLQVHRAARNIMLLLTRIEDFEERAIGQRGELEQEDREAVGVALAKLIQLLAPLAPHISEEIWSFAGNGDLVGERAWPVATGKRASEPIA
jgi:leucyl-tRNA synthetase